MEELKSKKFETIDILEKEIEDLKERLDELLGKLVDIYDKARYLHETISEIISYDSYINGVIAKAKKILQEYE